VTATATVRLGTRASRLALAQAAIAAEALAPVLGATDIVPMTTIGDAMSARRPRGGWVESDGQFTQELERALLAGKVDVVVHSYKDLPTAAVDGLVIGAVLPRADARDCLITRGGSTLAELPLGARIGTSSPRRAAQLAAARSDLVAMPIRGNVDTRLRRLAAGEFDAVILAAAGLDRLGVDVPESARLPYELVLPAPAQGALAVQVHSEAAALRAAVAAADHPPTRVAADAERALLRRLGGGCLAPLGALGEVRGDRFRLRAAFEDASGGCRRAEASGSVDEVDAVVAAVADEIGNQ
jgi:hydroxymethylbilane synthase